MSQNGISAPMFGKSAEILQHEQPLALIFENTVQGAGFYSALFQNITDLNISLIGELLTIAYANSPFSFGS
jgi:hypothetical protein